MAFYDLNLSGFGLDITDDSLKLIQARRLGASLVLQAWSQVSIKAGLVEKGTIVDRAKVLEATEELKASVRGKLTTNLVVASLPESKTFLKLFTLPKSEVRKNAADPLLEAIETELPKEIPLPLDSMQYDFQVISETEDSWQVLIGAVPREVVAVYTQLVKDMGFIPLALEIEAQAITRAVLPESYFAPGFQPKKPKNIKLFSGLSKKLVKKKSAARAEDQNSKTNPGNQSPIFLADIGASRSSLIAFHKGTIQFTRSLDVSGGNLSKMIAERLKLSAAKAEQAKVICGLDQRKCKGQVASIAKDWAKGLAQEIGGTIDFFSNFSGQSAPATSEILLCGGGAGLSGLDAWLAKQLNKPSRLADPFVKFKPAQKGQLEFPEEARLAFTTAVGLALR